MVNLRTCIDCSYLTSFHMRHMKDSGYGCRLKKLRNELAFSFASTLDNLVRMDRTAEPRDLTGASG
jgi:hypothetical protein